MDNDTSWCPACDRQILPKRFQVPVIPTTTTTPPDPAPPPSSPVRRTKVSRQRGGLVQGTGRVRPNGSIKRSESSKQQPPPPPPAAPIKLRTVIDQGPTPLYCSDECQMADINRGLPLGFNPDRERPDFDTVAVSSTSADTDSTASSVDSESSLESTSSQRTHMSPSLATLAAIYNFPPPPPPAPVEEPEVPSFMNNDYSSGIMMAARKITKELLPPPQKRNSHGHIISPTERGVIPGWTDGSNAWRASVYSLAAPNKSSQTHKSFAARSSRGITSTLTPSASFPRPSPNRAPASAPTTAADAAMLLKFSQSFTRCASRNAVASSSPASASSSPTSIHRRERSALREAEGKLLVPNVMQRVRSCSSTTSVSTDCSVAISRHGVRSPLSQSSICAESPASLPHSSERPVVETRSWSYDNVKTYPAMQPPSSIKIEKRIEKRIVDGKEVEVEVEVEVVQKLKRLFLFGPTYVMRG